LNAAHAQRGQLRNYRADRFREGNPLLKFLDPPLPLLHILACK